MISEPIFVFFFILSTRSNCHSLAQFLYLFIDGEADKVDVNVFNKGSPGKQLAVSAH
jgi:hypothetical protein